MADAVKVLRGLEEWYSDIRFIERLRHCVETYPDQNWEDAMSRGQVRSKQWVVHELILHEYTYLGNVAVCGGWLGTLSRMLLDTEDIVIRRIDSLDLDINVQAAACELNIEHFASGTFAPMTVNCEHHEYEQYDTIINTSCEHFEQFDHWWYRIPTGKLVVLQSNDFLEPDDHVNPIPNVDELVEMASMSEVIYQGTLPTHLYNRFMVIGIK